MPPKSGEFYTFDQVIRQLRIDEAKLKRLVSEGEIRAFREGDEMKFKKSDIDSLDVRATAEGETREIDLGSSGSEALTDDLIFDEGDELDLSSDDAGMATAEISSQDTFVDEGEPVGMSTEPLDFSEETFEVEEEYEEVAATTTTTRRTSRPAARARYEEKKPSEMGWNALLILSLIVMMFAGFVVASASSWRGTNSLSKIPVKIFDKKDWEKYKHVVEAPEGGSTPANE